MNFYCSILKGKQSDSNQNKIIYSKKLNIRKNVGNYKIKM